SLHQGRTYLARLRRPCLDTEIYRGQLATTADHRSQPRQSAKSKSRKAQSLRADQSASNRRSYGSFRFRLGDLVKQSLAHSDGPVFVDFQNCGKEKETSFPKTNAFLIAGYKNVGAKRDQNFQPDVYFSGELEFQSSRWRYLGGSNECPPATVSSYTVVVSHLAFGTLSLRS